jgi:hypothetical protein
MNTLKRLTCLSTRSGIFKFNSMSFSDNKFKDKESTEERIFIDKEESK